MLPFNLFTKHIFSA